MAEYEPGGTIRGLTEEDANKLILAWSKAVKGATKFLNKVNWPKSSDMGVMAPPLAERERTGLGEVLFGKAGENFEDIAYGGRGPFVVPETGPKWPYPKRGRAQEVVDMFSALPVGTATDIATGGKAGMTMAVPALAGVVRRKGDNITPLIAEQIAKQILPPPVKLRPDSYVDEWTKAVPAVGPPAPDQDPDLVNELAQKLARYVQRSAGTETDPLQGAQLWRKPSSPWYQMKGDEPMEPMALEDWVGQVNPNFRLPSSTALTGMDPERAGLPVPPGTAGQAFDEVAAAVLAPGLRSRKSYETANTIASLPTDLQKALDDFYRLHAEAYIPSNSEGLPNLIRNEAKQDLLTSGVSEENLDKVLAAMPPNTALATQKGLNEGAVTNSGGAELQQMLTNRQFLDAYARIPPSKRQSMDFPRIYHNVDQSLTKALQDYEKKLVGPIEMKYPDGMTWQKLDQEALLQREGTRQNICVGQEGYCKAVKEGEMEIFSLRDKQNKPAVTVSFYVKQPDAYIYKAPWPDGADKAQQLDAVVNWWDAFYKANVTPDNRQDLKDAMYYAGVSSSSARRLMKWSPEYMEVHPEDYEELRRVIGEATDPRADQDYRTFRARFLEKVPNPNAAAKTYELDQIKGKNNRYAHNWSNEEQDLWAPRVKELLDRYGASPSSSGDGRYLEKALDKVEQRKRKSTLAIGAFQWVTAPDGSQLRIVDIPGIRHKAWWDDEAGEVMMVPTFANGEIDWDNRILLEEATFLEEPFRRAIEDRFR